MIAYLDTYSRMRTTGFKDLPRINIEALGEIARKAHKAKASLTEVVKNRWR